jgi:hypothetical protein
MPAATTFGTHDISLNRGAAGLLSPAGCNIGSMKTGIGFALAVAPLNKASLARGLMKNYWARAALALAALFAATVLSGLA